MAIDIRVLGSGDEEVFDRVAPDVFDDPIQPESMRIFLEDPRHHVVVALDEALVVGFASGVHYHHPDKPAPELFINELGVAGPHQGQGVARRIVTRLLQVAREAGCAQAWVLTDREDTPRDQMMFSFPL